MFTLKQVNEINLKRISLNECRLYISRCYPDVLITTQQARQKVCFNRVFREYF